MKNDCNPPHLPKNLYFSAHSPVPFVIPVEAGIQIFACISWIPAFAGMTEVWRVTNDFLAFGAYFCYRLVLPNS